MDLPDECVVDGPTCVNNDAMQRLRSVHVALQLLSRVTDIL